MNFKANSKDNSQIKSSIATAIFQHREAVQAWFDQKFKNHPAAFYCSIDIRDSGQKIAPVDCNLFPAGFNNICEVDRGTAPDLFKTQIENMALHLQTQAPEKILIIPENHTQNLFYLENLYTLKEILIDAGYEVEIGRYSDEKTEYELSTHSGKPMTQYYVVRKETHIETNTGFTPDWIVLNNDFSEGFPSCLEGIRQPVLPTYRLGWHSRKKSTHFEHYNALAKEFADLVKVDPWHFTIESRAVDGVSFSDGAGLNLVADIAGQMLETMKADYEKRGIERAPTLFIKSNAGTYGMGIMSIQSVEELVQMNRRTKNKMSTGKGKTKINQVLIQEGVPSNMMVDGHASEPVIYIMGQELVGGFIRSNSERDDIGNLNSKGMYFKKLCFKDLSDSLLKGPIQEVPPLEAAYGIVAKLSAIAAAIEVQNSSQLPAPEHTPCKKDVQERISS